MQSDKPSKYSERQDVMKNMFAVHCFYLEVLKEFMEKLENPKTKTPKDFALRQDQVRELGEGIKYFLNKQPALYFNCLQMRESSASYLDQLPNEIKEAFANHQAEQFKREFSSAKDEPAEDSDDSDPDGDYAERAEQLTNAIFIGRFNANQIRRKPKEEKIFLELDDVFVKWADSGRDTYYDHAQFELTKVEKKAVKLPEEDDEEEEEEKKKEDRENKEEGKDSESGKKEVENQLSSICQKPELSALPNDSLGSFD